ncbi:hypothetical protein [Ilumatobacter nonamiensis]|uniref:hypothetical protein n=1 Tax=Ilumatobacter nonamiensis TaxID=467093 RepID=UPI0003468B41|nr:hypothetical protein [Ilumatobacter nonamiensis]
MAHHFILLPKGSLGSRFIDHALLNDPDLQQDLDQIFDLELVHPDDPRLTSETVEASLITQTDPMIFKAVVARDGRLFEAPRKLSRPLDSPAGAQAFLPQARVAVMDAVAASRGAERQPTNQTWLSNPAALIHRSSGPNEDYELTSRIVAELGNGRPLNVDPGFADPLYDGRRLADVSGPTSIVIEVSVPADAPGGAGTITATHVDTGVQRTTTLKAFPARAEVVLPAIQRLVEKLRNDVIAHSPADSSQRNIGDASNPEFESRDSVAAGDSFDVVVDSPPLRETLSLEPNPEPSHEQNATFQARIEILLGVANQFIDDGSFDDDPYIRDLVERDRNYMRAEAFETDEPFALGDAVGAIVARLERNLLSVARVPDTLGPLLDDLVEATSADSPDTLPDILDHLIDTARLDDPEWLASQNDFDAFASEIHELARYGARRWLMKAGDWWQTAEAEQLRHGTGWGVTVGGPAGSAIGLVVAAVSAATLGAAMAVGGVVGAVVGLSLAWFFGRYRNSDESSAD